jgi:mannose-6-phosphate isomerase-like protein (cupin superfamily)
MPVLLEGGCRVASLREGEPRRVDGVAVWRHAGRDLGSTAISLRAVEVAATAEAQFGNASCEEVLYVLEGTGFAVVDGQETPVSPDTGLFVPIGGSVTVRNRGSAPLLLASAQCPDPGPVPTNRQPRASGGPVAIVNLAGVEPEITGDRWYRVVIGDGQGSREVTQFVGGIPQGRAADHFHHYEEVLVILSGTGTMWAGRTHTPIGVGSCVFLPRGQLHCVENTGRGELRLLGAFYPAGSPAVRYSAADSTGDSADVAAPRRPTE